MSENREVRDAAFAEVYGELRRLAERKLARQPPGHTLQPTALVNEVFLRLAGAQSEVARDREHFLAIAARAMRQVLVDHARRRRAEKRGAGGRRVELEESRLELAGSVVDLVDLDDSLRRLEEVDARQARVVELRVFVGLTIAETATVLGVSHMTVSSAWRDATGWLVREFSRERRGEP